VVGIDVADVDGIDISTMDVGAVAKRVRGFDACVHLAAVASPRNFDRDPARGWTVNVQGTHNVLLLMQAAGISRMVFFSSAHVYGIDPKWMPTPEPHPFALHDSYTVSKIMGEHLCHLFHENAGIGCVNLRVYNAYGPGQSADYFLGNKLAQAREGRVTIRNGGTTKDWVHVDDVVEAARLSLGSGYVGPLNVGTGVQTSLGTIAEHVAVALDVPLVVEPDAGPDTRMCGDSSRARRVLGWEPRVGFLDEGLPDLLLGSR
jgi:UDP-glucose 4-epimerase